MNDFGKQLLVRDAVTMKKQMKDGAKQSTELTEFCKHSVAAGFVTLQKDANEMLRKHDIEMEKSDSDIKEEEPQLKREPAAKSLGLNSMDQWYQVCTWSIRHMC